VFIAPFLGNLEAGTQVQGGLTCLVFLPLQQGHGKAAVGKEIVVVVNLEPAKIRGEESQGMLLAASDKEGISILCPDRDVALGSPVK